MTNTNPTAPATSRPIPAPPRIRRSHLIAALEIAATHVWPLGENVPREAWEATAEALKRGENVEIVEG